MTPDNAQKLKSKIASLTDELTQLEKKLDDIVQRRCSATTAEEKRQRAREAGLVFPAMSDVQRRIDTAKRLLARGEGDEYDFVAR